MHQIVRALWAARALGSLAALAPAVALWGTSQLAWPALGLVLLAEAWGAATLHRYLAAVQSGNAGELMLANGARVPLAVLRAQQSAERLGHAVAALVAAVVLVAGITRPVIIGTTVVALVVQLLLVASRWGGWRQHTAYQALMNHQPQRALDALKAFRKVPGPLGRGIAHTRAGALAQLGQPEAALRELEAVWGGDYDATAALVALARLRRGDPELAQQWLAAQHPDDRYHAYLRGVVAGTLALHEADPHAALAATDLTHDLPAFQQRELELVAAAALQQAGRGDEARQRLDGLRALDKEAWRAQAQPTLWSLIDDARAGRASQAVRAARSTAAPRPQPPPPSDAFAAPAAPPTMARWRGVQVGVVPYESSALGPASERAPMLKRALVVFLVGLALLLAALAALLAGAGELEPELSAIVVLVEGLVALVVVLQGAREWMARRLRGSGPGMVLGDGRVLPEQPSWMRWLWSLSPALVLAALGVLPLIEWAFLGTAVSLVLLVVLAARVGLSTRRRLAAMRAAIAVHEAAPDEVVAIVRQQQGPFTTGWLYLAHLVAGDLDGAQAVVEEHIAILPQLAELGLWLRAAQGHVALDQLLQQEPTELGDRYRHAVAVRLAALAAGQAHRALDDGPQVARLADQLPNRFGGLLHRLQLEVLRRARPDEADAYEAAHAQALERGAWVPDAWVR